MYYGHDHMDGVGWLLGGGMMLLIAAIVLATIAIVGARREPRDREPSAREVLDRRLARGEIDADEYRLRRDLLGNS